MNKAISKPGKMLVSRNDHPLIMMIFSRKWRLGPNRSTL
jgi:hypothetical protein